jgi:ubiquinone/menaquinone biosynthesis C-methylase UbiE
MAAHFLVATLIVVASAVGTPGWSLAEPHGPDGATIHRRFDDAAYWSKVFDDPKRDAWQRPDEIVTALSLEPGMTVADIGAGTGYFSRRLSAAVGRGGTVFAVEVEPSLVTHMRDRADSEKTPNVIPVLASADNPRLPPAAIDVALFVDTYHHVDGRREYLATLRRSLKPSARVAIVEWKAGPQPFGPKEESHKLPREQVEREMAQAGFESLPVPDLLPHQYFLLFRATPPSR